MNLWGVVLSVSDALLRMWVLSVGCSPPWGGLALHNATVDGWRSIRHEASLPLSLASKFKLCRGTRAPQNAVVATNL